MVVFCPALDFGILADDVLPIVHYINVLQVDVHSPDVGACEFN